VGHLETREAMATWLSTFEWDYFCTLTFARPKRTDALALIPGYIERAVFPLPFTYGMAWFAEEYHHDGERLHMHGLVYTDPKIAWRRLAKGWRKKGRCLIETHDPGRGAVDYCAKYISKDAVNRGDWRIFEWEDGRRV